MTRSPLRPVVGWPAEYAERYRAAGYWTDESFDAFLAERVRLHLADGRSLSGRRVADVSGLGWWVWVWQHLFAWVAGTRCWDCLRPKATPGTNWT